MWHLVSSAMAVAVLLASNASCFADWENCTKGDIDHRIAACSQTIEEGPNGGTKRRDAYVIRGSLYLAKREFDLAIEDQSAAIRLDPNYAIAYDLRGGAFRQKGDFDRAIADFSEAIRRDPTRVSPYSNRALTYLAIDFRDDAVGDYRKVLELPAATDGDRKLRDYARAAIEALMRPKAVDPDPDPALNEKIVRLPLSLKLPTGDLLPGFPPVRS